MRHRQRGGRSDRSAAGPPGAWRYPLLGIPLRGARLFLRPQRLARGQYRGACRHRGLDRRRAALPAASEPFQCRRRARVDRTDQARPRDPDQSSCRSRLRRAAQQAAAPCGACLRRAEDRDAGRRARPQLSRFLRPIRHLPRDVQPRVGCSINRLAPGRCVTVNGEGGPIAALPVLQEHGDIPSLGFRFGGLAYSCDLSGLPEASIAALAGTEVWIVDALRYRPHPSHFSVDDALAWIARIKPGRAILTNLHSDLDYEELRSKLPPHVEPAFDGLRIELPDDALARS